MVMSPELGFAKHSPTSTTRRSAAPRSRRQLGTFALAGEGLRVGRDGGQPVNSDYEYLFHFVGGVIKQVIDRRSGRAEWTGEGAIGAFARD